MVVVVVMLVVVMMVMVAVMVMVVVAMMVIYGVGGAENSCPSSGAHYIPSTVPSVPHEFPHLSKSVSFSYKR